MEISFWTVVHLQIMLEINILETIRLGIEILNGFKAI